jgi:hypothetical protein
MRQGAGPMSFDARTPDKCVWFLTDGFIHRLGQAIRNARPFPVLGPGVGTGPPTDRRFMESWNRASSP